MKRIFFVPIILLTCFIPVSSISAQDLVGGFVLSGVSDANRLIDAYLSTTVKGMGQSMNDGWHNTAKPLGVLGWDLRFNVGFGFVPETDRSYDFYSIGLNTDRSKPYLVLPPGTDPDRPTVYGDHESDPPVAQLRMNYGGIDTMLAEFTMPTGTGYSISPSVPMIQGSVGIPLNTEVNLRFFPEAKLFENYRIGLLGFGVKHDIIQWIPAFGRYNLNDRRPFDWSVYASYTLINASYGDGPLLEPDSNAYNPDPSFKYDNQEIVFKGYAYTFGTIVSKEFGLKSVYVAPFVGINYAYSMVDLTFKGDYPLVVPNDQFSPEHPQVGRIERITDPIRIENTLSNMRLNIGFRVKLALFTLSTEYNLGKYNTISIGIGLNMQSVKPVQL